MKNPRFTHDIHRVLQSTLTVAMTLVSAVFIAFVVYQIRSSNKQVENLILDHTDETMQSAALDGNLFETTKIFDRLATNIHRALGVHAFIQVFIGDRLHAQSGGSVHNSLFSVQHVREIRLPDSRPATIRASVDYWPFLLRYLTILAIILITLLLVIKMLRWKITAVVTEMTKPLDILVESIKCSFENVRDFTLPLVPAKHHEFNLLNETLIKYTEQVRHLQAELADAKVEQKLLEISERVTHDVNSPLVALESLLDDKTLLSHTVRRHLRTSTTRIREIVGSLKSSEGTISHQPTSPTLMDAIDTDIVQVASVCREIVDEKRLQYLRSSEVDIEIIINSEAYGLFGLVDLPEFKRAVSNLIDNAVEATGGTGNVTLHFQNHESLAEIIVTDDGCGIPPEIMAKLGQKGVTSKPNGSGLGFYATKQSVERWGGEVTIRSSSAKGTSISMRLRKDVPPSWFAANLPISSCPKIFILDDDRSVPHTWKAILARAGFGDKLEIEYFPSATDFLEKLKTQWTSIGADTLFLLDYDFRGEAHSGVEVAIELKRRNHNCILVTSRLNDPQIQSAMLEHRMQGIEKKYDPVYPDFYRYEFEFTVGLKRLKGGKHGDDYC